MYSLLQPLFSGIDKDVSASGGNARHRHSPSYVLHLFCVFMIGIFDSGIGGMTVAKAVSLILPDISIRYVGDTAGAPYGQQKPSSVVASALAHVGFLIKQGARLIIITGDRTAHLAGQALREKYSLPIIDMATPTALAAAAATSCGRIGIIGSRAAIDDGFCQQKITTLQPKCRVHTQPCPLLAALIEEGWQNRQETKMILRRYLQPLKNRQIDTLVLDSPYYSLIRHLIQPRIGKRVQLIDSATVTASYVRDLLADHPDWLAPRSTNVHHQFWLTSLAEPLPTFTNTAFQGHIDLQLL